MTLRTKTLNLGLIILLIAGCHIQSVRHDPVKAAFEINGFLKAVYVNGNYSKALELADVQFRQSVTPEGLRQLAEGIRTERGELKTLKADSYLMTMGSTMELFYVGTYEKGTLYHRVVLAGDLSTSYRVSGIWYSVEPYPEQTLRRRFEQEILVK